jgi:CheY-like chemotaxis protein
MQVQVGELFGALQAIQEEKFTGVAEFESLTNRSASLKYAFAFRQGAIVYAGKKIPNPMEFTNWMRSRMKLHHLESTLQVVSTRIKNEESVRELVGFIARFGLIKWEDLEMVMYKEIAIIIEHLTPYSGSFINKAASSFDLCYGEDNHSLNLTKLRQVVAQRHQQWAAIAIDITPRTVPILRQDTIGNIPPSVLPHLQKWATGKFKLAEIATSCGEDALQLAQAYLLWSQQGWLELSYGQTSVPYSAVTTTEDLRPTILSLDDSKIVQVSIRKSIGDLYNVVFADNALDAMEILNQQNVALLLLDVTMPDVDGLELCRVIRNIDKFKNLPIVMLTAKDGFLDKVKGQFAGSTHYLIKPVDRVKLLPVLEKYILKTAATK